MKKFLIALAAALVLCVPAFAIDVVNFSDELTVSFGDSYSISCSKAGEDDVYFYAYYSSDDPSTVSVNAISSVYQASYTGVGQTAYGAYNYTGYVQTSAGDYYTGPMLTVGGLNSFTPNLSIYPYGTTSQEISDDFAAFLENPNGTPDTIYNFNLPRGNVLYFQVSSESDVNITSYMETLSLIVNGQSSTYGPWGDTGQRYGPAAALPTSGTTYPLLSQDPIHWNKDASQNMLGQTKIGRKTVHCIAGQWYCFYNPNANHVEGGDPYQATVGATVNFKGSFSQVKVYPVSQKLSVVDGDLYSGSDDDFSSYYDGTLNENGTVSWTNQDGNIESPSAGGQNFQDGPQTADSLLEQIKITLSTVVSELQTLFTFGYEAIQSLVGLMRDFVSVFSGLYTWLPAPVYSALISAVIVAIVIGVFKVFL